MSKEPITLKSNSKAIFEAIGRIGARVKNLKPIMREIAYIMQRSVESNFDTEGKSGGEKWQAWGDDYKKLREKMGYGNGKILTLRGDLRKSFVREATSKGAIVGTNKVYAAIHNFGGPVKKRGSGTFNMPARPFMLWTEQLKEQIVDELGAHLAIKDDDIKEAKRLK